MRKIEAVQREPSFRINLGEYARVIWRKKYFLIIPLLISVVVSNIGVRFLVPIYESGVVIRVEDTSDVNREVARFLTQGRRRSRDAETKAEIQAAVGGSEFLDAVIRHLGMDRDPALIRAAERQRENLFGAVSAEELLMRRLRNILRQRIGVSRVGPSMFRITYADANPEACYVIVQAMTEVYIENQQRRRLENLEEVSQFSEEQLAVAKERLDRSVQALQDFQKEMAERSVGGNPVTVTNIGVAETVRRDLDLTIRSGEAARDKIRGRLVDVMGRAPSSTGIRDDAQLRQLEDNLIGLREAQLMAELVNDATLAPTAGSTTEQNILVTQQGIQQRLGVLVRSRFGQVNADYRPLIVEYFYQSIEVDAYKQKRNRLVTYINAFRSEVARAPQMESELQRLRQDVEHNRNVYNQFRASQTSTQISEAVESTDLGEQMSIVETATMPLSPVRPDKMKILALAFMFGLAVGGGGLLLTEFSDSSFRSVDDVERALGLKVLGTVPRFDRSGRYVHEASRKRALIWTAASVIVVAAAISGFYFYGKSAREQMVELKYTTASEER